MAGSATQSLGAKKERIARRFLRHHGLSCIAKNCRSRFGEIDLIMDDGGCVVIVEVRFRQHNQFASATESVTAQKQRRIVLATRHWLARNPHQASKPMRFDVVGIDDVAGRQQIRWIKDAFRVD